ncbi:MAG TPA: hypothetical protein VMT63_14415 [Bacteroidales bacterium]|nr:hypothetical protein [Bacteroidales bacterium]
MSRGRSVLKNKSSRIKRTRFKGNILTAKKIGLLWDASDPDEFQVLSHFHQLMQERNIDLEIMGYYPGKAIPDRITAIRYLVCLKNEDLNWTYRPVSREAVRFISTPFDILIDANFRNQFPLEYMSTLSVAGLKAGLYSKSDDQSHYDIMIDTGGDKDLNKYLDQVVHYLELINTGSK